jgi:hypothetical protein
VRARVDAGDASEAGLTVWMDERAHYDIAVSGDRVVARARIGPLVDQVASAPVSDRSSVVLELRCMSDVTGTEPDLVVLGHDGEHGEFVALATLPGRYLSTEVAGGFTGRVIAMFSTGGTARFDWYEALRDV